MDGPSVLQSLGRLTLWAQRAIARGPAHGGAPRPPNGLKKTGKESKDRKNREKRKKKKKKWEKRREKEIKKRQRKNRF